VSRRAVSPPSRAAPTHLRVALALGQLLTILSTWSLWQPRDAPPLLPMATSLSAPIPWGVLLLATLFAAWRWPQRGSWAHLITLLASCVFDVTRFGPAPLSLAILLLTTSTPTLTSLGGAQLSAMWMWAGLHKLLSPAYFAVVVPVALSALPQPLPQAMWIFGVIVPAVEITLGVCAAFARTRGVARVLAPLVHLAALTALVALDLNPGIWAWNAALAWCAPRILLHEPMPRLPTHRVLAAILYAGPALFYLGVLHPTLAHQLYSGAAPTTLTCRVDGCRSDVEQRDGLAHFGVPIPPSPATLRAYFLETCAPGDRWILRSRTRGRGHGAVIDTASCADPPGLPPED
jgi:hypothetical protein